jgi:flavin reductase (DIM6/NTAB) family NADH-FMN oxidoreductase RutF
VIRAEEVPSLPERGGLSADELKAAFRNHPAGVAVITADAGDGPVGLTATSVFSVSAEPALFVFSLSSQSSSAATIFRADTVVVHLLGAHQLHVARLFSTSGVDRFADARRRARDPGARGARRSAAPDLSQPRVAPHR